MKTVFMGTPIIAAKALESLIASDIEVAAVVTRPDAPSGRGKSVNFSPVKQTALEAGIEVLQPEKDMGGAFLARLKEINPDIITVMAYGRIIKEDILNLPKYGCINAHASLLPKYRGASPIQWAVIDGEKESGITIMKMSKGLDCGDIIMTEKIVLDPEETAESLAEKMSVIAGPLMIKAMKAIEAGTATYTPQDDSQASYVTVIDKSLGNLDFTKSAQSLERMMRGLFPWPGSYTFHNGKMIKLFGAQVSDVSLDGNFVPGRVCLKGGFYIETGMGSLKIIEAQAEGKKRMEAKAFLNGYRIASGDILSQTKEGN